MKQIYFLVIALCIWSGKTIGVNTAPTQATRDLWMGIMKSQPRTVRHAIQRGANLSTRVSHYEDTPLTAAMRIYGKSLISRLKGTGRDLGTRLTHSLIGSTLLSALIYFVTQKSPDVAIYSWLVSFPLLLRMPQNFWFGISAEAKVIEVLLQNLPPEDAQQRNKEGLNALEVLGAYHPYANELQDEVWEQIMSSLIRASSDGSISYDPMNDIASALNSLGNKSS